jgi:hypothetical protein
VFGRRMPTYAVYGGWIISIIAGWFEVTADTVGFISSDYRGPCGPNRSNEGLFICFWKLYCRLLLSRRVVEVAAAWAVTP